MPKTTKPSVPTVEAFLRGAADQIRDHGWVQHEYGSDEVGLCAVAAVEHERERLEDVLEDSDLTWSEVRERLDEVESRAFALLAHGLPRSRRSRKPKDPVRPTLSDTGRLVAFNDATGRKRGEVLRRFKRAFTLARS